MYLGQRKLGLCQVSYIVEEHIPNPNVPEPDPCGVLEAGEIFLKTSEGVIGQDGLSRDHLLGDVLVRVSFMFEVGLMYWSPSGHQASLLRPIRRAKGDCTVSSRLQTSHFK